MRVLFPAVRLRLGSLLLWELNLSLRLRRRLPGFFARALMRDVRPGMSMTDFANARLRIWLQAAPSRAYMDVSV